MGDYLKLFNTHSEYEEYIDGDNVFLPNVSHCKQQGDVHYNPWTWAEEYLTTVALEDGTISFNILKTMGTDMITSISYSTDGGETWTTTANQNNKQENISIDVDVEEGDKVMWKGIATQTGYFDDDYYGTYAGSFFSSDCEFDAKGNAMSLLYGDDFKGNTTLEYEGQFACLFSDSDVEKTCNIVNANNLSLAATTLADGCYKSMFVRCTSLATAPVLPATTLTDSCYSSMFGGCTSLVTAPELPATTLVRNCYSNMFDGCTSLTTAPELPATTLGQNCYGSMFYGCTSLTTAPELPATTLESSCYEYMFYECTALTTAPELPATTLANFCYHYMFQNCSSLTTAPELPATTLASNCYASMFDGCTALTTASELPATTLADYCHEYIFNGCTSLTTASELPATTLVRSCYYHMFQNCTNLNYIKAMFTTTPSGSSPNYYTQNWVSGVAASGTFVKNSAATWTTRGVHGIPTGWTVETANP